ncbi:MAG: ATP-binding protein [Henriciella sp.]|nr:ATP-binding protein [Henriciella sp.]
MDDGLQEDAPEKDFVWQRRKDFFVLTTGAAAVLTLLFVTNAIGLVEWITGGVVMIAGSLAYFVGSVPYYDKANLVETEATVEEQTPPEPPIDVLVPFLKALPFPAVLVDTDKRIHATNEGVLNVFGSNAKPGALASAVFRNPDLLAATDRVAETGAAERVEIPLKGDTETWIAHIHAAAGTGSVTVVMEELTAVRRAEQARADFLANASHELRTPLTAISGFIETMRGPAKDDKAAWDGFISIIAEQTERMKRLVADLLSLSRIEFREHRPPSTTVDFSALIQHAALSLAPLANDRGVDLSFAGPDVSLNVVADEDEITQVIQNLASNAIKYTSKGGTVQVTFGHADTMAEAALASGRQMPDSKRAILVAPRASSRVPAVWMRVTDSGEGIPAQHLPRLGERFYRVDESRGGKIEGTGLGLAIVKHIMVRHRGGLSVESIEGEGAGFGMWMPGTVQES